MGGREKRLVKVAEGVPVAFCLDFLKIEWFVTQPRCGPGEVERFLRSDAILIERYLVGLDVAGDGKIFSRFARDSNIETDVRKFSVE